VLDQLGVERAKLVGHDWGAVIGWWLAGAHGDRFERYAALSVGHMRAYGRAGLEQKLKAWYILVFLVPGLAETLFGAGDFALLRAFLGGHKELENWTRDLARAGRFTAALNWYRANLPRPSARFGRVEIPVMGVWSDRDVALAEDQMKDSARGVDAPFRYERLERVGHWMPLDAPEKLSALLIDFFGEEDPARAKA
jgi:pimeloyl-ACP methyl ester carboxylesterase